MNQDTPKWDPPSEQFLLKILAFEKMKEAGIIPLDTTMKDLDNPKWRMRFYSKAFPYRHIRIDT